MSCVMEGRRRLKRKSNEDQMNERDNRQSSVRARISVVDDQQPSSHQTAGGERKRFTYPGKLSQELLDQSHLHQSQHQLTFSSPSSSSRPGKGTTTATDFEAHLQEVWSVRKNVHHKQSVQNPTTTNSGSKTSILQSTGPGASSGGLTQAEKYSRYGALPISNTTSDYSPDRNRTTNTTTYKDSGVAIETVTPWSLKKPTATFTGSKYTDHKPQQHQSTHPPPPSLLEMATPHTTTTSSFTSSSPPRIKGRGRPGEPARICREDFEPAPANKREHNERVDYAKSMAKGYLRSVGSGEYAPSQSNYTKHSPSSTSSNGDANNTQNKWKRAEADEFDF